MSREFHIKGGDRVLATIKSFSPTEKVIFGIAVIAAFIGALLLAWRVNERFLVSVPSHGGRLAEGVVGLPRSINPVLAFTDVDHDLSSLIYSGLMKYEDGKLVPDLAKSYTVSSDGLTYDFILRDEIRFHDGVPLTTDDIEYTIQKIQDPVIKSPRRADWANITIKKVSSTEIQFLLKQPYSPFLANTTVGILPKHIWSKVDADQFIFSQYNIEPVGSGPYSLKNIARDNGGIPVSYTLSSFSRYYAGEPYISEVALYFYPNETAVIDAYQKGTIQAMARISAQETATIASTTPSAVVLHTPLPRIFGIFFNQNQNPVFANVEVRKALSLATDKKKIVDEVLSGYGVESDGPLPDMNAVETSGDINKAKDILSAAGWTAGSDGILVKKDKKGGQQVLSFSIATADSPDLKETADIVKADWEKLGAQVTIKIFEYGDLSQNIIAPRKYDALLFGETVGKDLDLYAFWHSSQRNSPGLNVAMYVNSKVDKLLEDARASTDPKAKDALYDQFDTIIRSEAPAVFLYAPEFTYIVPESLNGVDLGSITDPANRFYGINRWYITTDSVWKIFNKSQNNQ